MAIITFSVTLEDSYMISSKVKHFVLKTDHSPVFDYKPGQFITIHFEKDGKMLKRSYSIANPPEGDNRIEFAAGEVEGGPGTELLFNLKPGDKLQINGPFGRLVLKDPLPQRVMLIATSTGVTPYRAMLPVLRQYMQQHEDFKLEILQVVQHTNEVLYADEFRQFSERFSGANFTACLSRADTEGLQSFEQCGYVQHQFARLNPDPETDLIYLCGNPAMIDEAFAELKERGFTMQQIVREKYISN